MKRSGSSRIQLSKLKNGFYIEVCNKGVKRGLKIRSESKIAMENAADLYALFKDVIILGEYKNGELVIEQPVL